MEIDELEYILDHYKYPRNQGKLEDPDISHEEGNPICGDKVRLEINLKDNIIKDIKFTGKGCTISQAAASMLTEMIINKDLEHIKSITPEQMLKMLNVEISPVRYKCATLPLKVLINSLQGLINHSYKEEIQ